MSLLGTGLMAENELSRELGSGWKFRQVGEDVWRSATVPGCNHTDLLDHGLIDDPFWRLNEKDLQWIDKEDWEYQLSFSVDEEWLARDRVELNFQGLDTYADVRVNGVDVLRADNMFRDWCVDAKEVLRVGENELSVVLRSPIKEGVKKYDALDYVIPATEVDQAEHGQVEGGKRVSVHTRKAGYHFGWDWGPRLVPSGIWRPVVLKAWDEARVLNVQVIQESVSEVRADLSVVFEIESEVAAAVVLEVDVEGEGSVSQSVSLDPGVGKHAVKISIERPRLWWCNGLGEPNLYQIKSRLLAEGGEGKISEVSERIGIRTIELVQEADEVHGEPGSSFYFKLNGEPVFMKGANYIPNDIYQTRVSDEKYRQVIDTAKQSNFNMLRVWGGGFYENDLFYDLCDEAGILVWQDFMFACAMFPGDEAFLDNVRREAIDNVKRLRNHASVCLWCGNNEIVVAWERWGWKDEALEKGQAHVDRLWNDYVALFHGVLADVAREYDPTRSYWSSSPTSEPGVVPSLTRGDEHYWGVWHAKEPYENYATHIGRFMSEYGFQSFPELRTIKEYALPEDYGLLTEVMKAHQRSPVGNGAIEHYMLQSYNKAEDFEEFLYLGQVLQAELIKYAIEAHRRAMPYCMGTLYWQLNDCWPVASWSSMDSSLRWKAQQYFVKKAYEPLMISVFEKEAHFCVHLINDHLRDIEGELRLRVIDFSGDLIEGRGVNVNIPANSSAVYFESDVEEMLDGYSPKNSLLVVELMAGGKIQSRALHYFAKVKDLELPKPSLESSVKEIEGGYELSLLSDKLAKNLYLTIGDEEGVLSDNYFDLLPGEEVRVKVETSMSRYVLEQVLQTRCIK